jgi:HAD superfamily hydrolase (TIGR01490 family)
MHIAFFDLDKTIFAENSAKLWLKDLWQRRHIKPIQMVHASYMLAKYHLGFAIIDDVIIKSLALLAGQCQNSMMEETSKFFFSKLKGLYRPGAVEAIKEHRALGNIICLLTSTFDGLAMLVKRDLKLDHCLCTTLEVDQRGNYTGKTVGLPCFGRHKVAYAQELCSKLNISLKDCIFYTDSASDIPLLSLIGHAVAVNPDPHLRAQARIRKWEIVDWGKPHG